LRELSQHKFKFNPYLEDLYQSDKPLIIYKVDDGYNIYTDFSKKIVLTKKNIHNFLNSLEKKKYKKETDLYLGFFGYENLCNLIGINLKKKKRINFYKGIFYKPETIIKIRKDIKVISNLKKNTFNYQFNKTQILSPFKINISYAKYKKIFELFSKKIREGETYQIKICTKYKNRSKINPINFFWRLMRVNSSPESFMIRDKDYSIVSCSPETLIEKKGNKIITFNFLLYLENSLLMLYLLQVVFLYGQAFHILFANECKYFSLQEVFAVPPQQDHPNELLSKMINPLDFQVIYQEDFS